MKTFFAVVWAYLKEIGRWCALKLAAPGVALLVVAGAILLVALGFKELQIGGLLGKLLGLKDPVGPKVIDIINTIPKGRIDANGNLIPLGQPDSKGDTQVQVVPIENPWFFSNPGQVTFTPPGETKATTVVLPDGVKSSDVAQVVVVKPDVFAVAVKDSSGVTSGQIDDLLKKYGG